MCITGNMMGHYTPQTMFLIPRLFVILLHSILVFLNVRIYFSKYFEMAFVTCILLINPFFEKYVVFP